MKLYSTIPVHVNPYCMPKTIFLILINVGFTLIRLCTYVLTLSFENEQNKWT